jgi:hypothetical protein
MNIEDFKMTSIQRKVIGIVQPTYLPWLPFFERMVHADVFIYLDDVKYSKNSFHNRNSVKGPKGKALLTVPVLYAGNSDALINEIKVDNTKDWRKTHWKSIQQWYAKAPFLNHYKSKLEELFYSKQEKLIDVVLPYIQFLKQELKIQTPCHLSSSLSAIGSRNEKLVNLCKHFGGTGFIVKPGTEDYHPPEEFSPHGIDLTPLRYTSFKYSQLHGDFESNLSALDFILNCGPTNLKEILSQQRH